MMMTGMMMILQITMNFKLPVLNGEKFNFYTYAEQNGVLEIPDTHSALLRAQVPCVKWRSHSFVLHGDLLE